VFFWNESKIPWWKIVLHKAPQSRRIVANTLDDFVDTHRVVSMFATPMEFTKMESDRTW
jgi:hypothetical protein